MCVFVRFELKIKLIPFSHALVPGFQFILYALDCIPSNDFLYVLHKPKLTFTSFMTQEQPNAVIILYNIGCVCETVSQVLNGMAQTNPDEKSLWRLRKRVRERERGRMSAHIKRCVNSQVDYYIA